MCKYGFMELTSKDRKFLEKCAHSLNPLVLIGGAGATDAQITQIDAMLKQHELIKVHFNEFKDEKRELSEQIAQATNSTLVRIIGNTAILYRMADEKKKRQYLGK